MQKRPEWRKAVKDLWFLNIGGSMYGPARHAQALFAAARAEFRQLSVFNFHHCIHEAVRTDTSRRIAHKTATLDILRRFGPNNSAIFVGGATMRLYEVNAPGGSVKHWNAGAGRVWLTRACTQ